MVDSDNTPASSSNKAGLYLIPVCTLSAVALALVIARVYTRLRRTGKLFFDDWLVVAAEVLSLTDTAIAIAAATHGWGKPSHMFTPEALKETLRLQFALQVVWTFTLCLVRVAVACSLLRFGTDPLWRIPLHCVIGLQVLISTSYIVIQFGQCTPMSSNWEAVPGVKCWDNASIVVFNWVIAVVYIIMDLTLSLMTIRLIRNLRRSTTERILVGILMSLGLLATAVACIKMTTFKGLGKGDVMQATIKPSMLARVEEIVGIIACSLACLKSSVEKVLTKLGILKQRRGFVNALNLADFGEQQDDSRFGTDGKGSVVIEHGDLTSKGSKRSTEYQGHPGALHAV